MVVDPSQDEPTARELTRLLSALLPAGAVGSVDRIREGDEQQLAPSERCGLESAVIPVRRASGAARRLARSCCDRLGVPVSAIPRSPDRLPVWPAGLVGSLAHDAEFAAAVVARRESLGALGIDLEAAEPLEDGLVAVVASERERAFLSGSGAFAAKALFALKEAVFKAVYPLDRVFLEFEDVAVEESLRFAETEYGRRVACRVITQPRVLAVAWVTDPVGGVIRTAG